MGSNLTTTDPSYQKLVMSICFPAKTPVLTDQGKIYIDKIVPGVHTISKKPIRCVTKTILNEKHLVCIEKDAFGKNTPSENTLISLNHKVCYEDKMVKAKSLVGSIDNVYYTEYNGETLYNIMLDDYETMI